MDLDEYADTYRKNDRKIGLMQANGHWVSRWPPGTALFCVPFYALPVALGIEVPSLDVDMLAKLTASMLTAASAVLRLPLPAALRLAARGDLDDDRLRAGHGRLPHQRAGHLDTRPGPVLPGRGPLHRPRRTPPPGVAPAGRAPDRTHGRGPPAVASRWPSPSCFWIAYRNGLLIWVWYALGGLLPALFLLGYNMHYFGTPGFGGYEKIVGGGWNLGGLPKAFARPARQPQPRHADLLPLPALLHLRRGRRAAAGGTPLPDAGPGARGGPDQPPPPHRVLASLARHLLLWIPLLDRRPALLGALRRVRHRPHPEPSSLAPALRHDGRRQHPDPLARRLLGHPSLEPHDRRRSGISRSATSRTPPGSRTLHRSSGRRASRWACWTKTDSR